jgi:hypothetical protein
MFLAFLAENIFVNARIPFIGVSMAVESTRRGQMLRGQFHSRQYVIHNRIQQLKKKAIYQ